MENAALGVLGSPPCGTCPTESRPAIGPTTCCARRRTASSKSGQGDGAHVALAPPPPNRRSSFQRISSSVFSPRRWRGLRGKKLEKAREPGGGGRRRRRRSTDRGEGEARLGQRRSRRLLAKSSAARRCSVCLRLPPARRRARRSCAPSPTRRGRRPCPFAVPRCGCRHRRYISAAAVGAGPPRPL